MRRSDIFFLFVLGLIFDSAYSWWAAAGRMAEPIILSVGAAFAALGLNEQRNQDEHFFDRKVWKFWNKAAEKDEDESNGEMELFSPEEIADFHKGVEELKKKQTPK